MDNNGFYYQFFTNKSHSLFLRSKVIKTPRNKGYKLHKEAINIPIWNYPKNIIDSI